MKKEVTAVASRRQRATGNNQYRNHRIFNRRMKSPQNKTPPYLQPLVELFFGVALASVAGVNLPWRPRGCRVLIRITLHKLAVECRLLLVCRIVDMDSNLVSELLADLLKG